VVLDSTGKVLDMEEKPQEPKSNMAANPFYIYRKDTVPMFKEYLDAGENPDAPGNFPSWLHKRKTVMGYKVDGFCIDIGTPANLEYVNENFDEIFGTIGPVAEFIGQRNGSRAVLA